MNRIDTFKILKAKYPRSKRIWIGAIGGIGGLTLMMLSMFCLPLITRISNTTIVFFVFIFLVTSIFFLTMDIIEKKIINAYFVVGRIVFGDKSLSVKAKEPTEVEYSSIKIIYLSPTLIQHRHEIAFTAQIVTADDGVLEVHIHRNADQLKEKKRLSWFKTKRDIFDALYEKRIRYEWTRRKKNYKQYVSYSIGVE